MTTNKEVGALISLQPNASRIAELLGVTPFLEAAQPSIDTALQIYDAQGVIVNTIPLESQNATAARICYHRMDLHDALKKCAMADDGVTLPAGIRVASKVVLCDADNGVVVLESGERVETDVFIGADGIHSLCRASVLSETEFLQSGSPKRTGISTYRLLIPTSRLVANSNIVKHFDATAQVTSLIVGPDQRVVMGPARQGVIFGICALVPDEKVREDSHEDKSWISPGSLDKLLETFAGFPQWLKDMFSVAAGPESDIALWQLRNCDPLPRWSRGRLILVGDATHAMLPTQGQGASQSFEDGEGIATFLNDIHRTIHTARGKYGESFQRFR